MVGTIFAACTVAGTMMWAASTVLRLALIIVLVVQLKRE